MPVWLTVDGIKEFAGLRFAEDLKQCPTALEESGYGDRHIFGLGRSDDTRAWKYQR